MNALHNGFNENNINQHLLTKKNNYVIQGKEIESKQNSSKRKMNNIYSFENKKNDIIHDKIKKNNVQISKISNNSKNQKEKNNIHYFINRSNSNRYKRK